MPRDVTCGEIGIVAKIAAANSRPTTDQVFIVFLLVFNAPKDEPDGSTGLADGGSGHADTIY